MKPKLRFTEFNSDWNKTTLKNIAIINPKNENIPDKFIYIDLESVNKGILSQEKIISKSDAPSRAQRTVKKNDILFQTVRPYQQNNYFVKEIKDLSYVASTGYALIRTNENPYFIYSILHKKDFLDKVIDRCTGTSFPAISSNDLADININIPDIQEQTKISNFLSLIDKKIELQTKKIEDLKLFKKGLHNRLFNEVDGDDYLLSDIAIFENGKGHENIVDDNGEYVLINSKFISTEGSVIKKCSEQLTPLFKNDITMVMSDLPNGKALGKCYYINEDNKYSLNQRICKIQVKNNKIVNSKYLFYLLNRNPYYLKFDDGVNQTNLKKDDILNINLVLPSKEVQDKNSKILTIIDNLINKERDKLLNLNSLKKGLMQNMFV